MCQSLQYLKKKKYVQCFFFVLNEKFPYFRVKYIKGLRVADTSIMPKITHGNTGVPAIMIGEKAADIIKETIQCEDYYYYYYYRDGNYYKYNKKNAAESKSIRKSILSDNQGPVAGSKSFAESETFVESKSFD